MSSPCSQDTADELTVFSVVDYARYKTDREQKSIQLGQDAGVRVAEALDTTLLEIAERAEEYSAEVAAIDSEAPLLASID